MSNPLPTEAVRRFEETLVSAFIVPAKRERYRTLLAHPKRRARILEGLNHCHDFDPRYATPIASNTPCIAALLRSRGAPEVCHVISDISTLDGREMRLEDAISDAEMGGFGTVIGCLLGRRARFQPRQGRKIKAHGASRGTGWCETA